MLVGLFNEHGERKRLGLEEIVRIVRDGALLTRGDRLGRRYLQVCVAWIGIGREKRRAVN